MKQLFASSQLAVTIVIVLWSLLVTASAQAPSCQELSLNSCQVLPSATYKAFCKYADGAVYEGDMDCQGYPTGQGEMRMPDGSFYSGSWRQGYYHGYGRSEAAGEIYQGEFFQGDLTGQGTYWYQDGSIAEGKFKSGLLNGRGKFQASDGSIAEGVFVNGTLSNGVSISANGENVWRGSFQNGQLISGSYKDKNGEYSGQFKNGLLNGAGEHVAYDANGVIAASWFGNFVDGQIQGKYEASIFANGKLDYREKGAIQDGVAIGLLQRDFVDGSKEKIEHLGKKAFTSTFQYADGSVIFAEIDDNGWLLTNKWLIPPAKREKWEYETLTLSFPTKHEAEQAQNSLKQGSSVDVLANSYGIPVRQITIFGKSEDQPAQYLTDYYENLYTALESAEEGGILNGPLCDQAPANSDSIDVCDVIFVSKIRPNVSSKTIKEKPKAPKNKNQNEPQQLIQAASGSGFFITDDGVAVTNSHVINECQQVTANISGQRVDSQILADDKINDVAVLKFDVKTPSYLKLAEENGQLMDEIYVAGYPFGDAISSSLKVTRGIVSSVAGLGNNFSQMQIDAALQPGNSGGPVVNKNGGVVGIAVAKLDFKQVLENFGALPEDTNFAVKLSVLNSILDGLGIRVDGAAQDEKSSRELGQILTNSTVNLSCFMTRAQLDGLQTVRSVIKTD